MKKALLLVATAAILGGCATTDPNATSMGYSPIVDFPNGVTPEAQEKFRTDARECRNYAEQRPSAAQGAMAGALAGAIIGALFGAVIGNSRTAGQGALIGGASAGGTGAMEAEGTQRQIIRRCLAGRGWNVLD